ncbi:MAG: hypothetical protein KDD02_15480 [Phaeodactylibacter sp.]|nr:hypothetical protein [Phaeodactylibacter sp.]MCB9304051.1 hypothetical protein [Lewinellaceae bacterium]
MSRKTAFYIFLILLVLCAFFLVTGSPLLEKPILREPLFPAGAIIAWVGILALPASIYFGIENIYTPRTKPHRAYNLILKILTVLALLWGLVCFALADNWNFSFKNQEPFRGSTRASVYFWYFNAMVVLVPLVFLAVYGVHGVITTLQKKRSQ